MALVEYEVQRLQRIADNRRRMEEMGIFTAKDQLAACVERRKKHNRPTPAASLGPRKPRAPAGPARKSTRLEGRPAPIYNESALEQADGPERKKRGHLPEHHVASEEEIYTEEHINLLGSCNEPWELFKDGYDSNGNRIYDKVEGMTCHQCRQKTLGRHTSCSKCQTLHEVFCRARLLMHYGENILDVEAAEPWGGGSCRGLCIGNGVFCGDCLFMRYGENILEVEAAGPWECPPCRGLCNCSFHRIRRGWAPTGTLYRRAIAEGYKSVAHYLVLTNQAEAKATEANSDAAAAPAEPAINSAAAAADVAAEEPAGEDASAEGLKAPETPHKTSKKGAKAGNAASKKRQSHIDEMLHKTRRGAVAKTGKPIKTTALADALSGAVAHAKKHDAAMTVTPTGLVRITRGAAAVISKSAEVIRAHVQRTLCSAA